jgi:hypothetical protein
MEPSSKIKDVAPRDFTIVDNHFFNTGTIAIAIIGVSENDPASHIEVRDNIIEHTSVLAINVEDVRIENNVIRGSELSPIRIQKASRNVWIVGNEIHDEGALHPQMASVVLAYDTPSAPTDIHVIDNVIRSGSHAGIYARDSERLRVSSNHFVGTGAAAVYIEDIVNGSPLSGFIIEDNIIDGYAIGIRFHSRGDILMRACSLRNRVTGSINEFVVSGPIRVAC